jgi:myo-inositol-1(or 4)-monophosphatase
MDQEKISELVGFAQGVLEQAGDIALSYFRAPLSIDNKNSGAEFDPVTKADREVEAFIRTRLGEKTPEFGITGEEQGIAEPNGPGNAEIHWVIDPIDGTRAFISGFPTWGILLGLTEGERCLAGLMHQPFTGETFLSDGRSSWMTLNQQRTELRTRPTESLDQAILYCTDPDMFTDTAAINAFKRVAAQARLRRFGGDCYSYCMLASGQVDLVVEGDLQPYDIIALIPIIEAAGGVVTNWQGEPANAGGLVVAAATKSLHTQVLKLLQG